MGEEEQTDGGVGGQGGHEDDEDDDGDDVGFLCRKNSCSEHIYDNSAPSASDDSLMDNSSRERGGDGQSAL